MNETIKATLPEQLFRSIADKMNSLWSTHPDNPDRKPDPPKPSYSSGPSGP